MHPFPPLSIHQYNNHVFSTTMPLLQKRIFFDINTFIWFSSSMQQILATLSLKKAGECTRLVTPKADNSKKKKILNEDTQIWNNSFGRGFEFNCSWNTVVTIDKQITFFFSVFQKNWSHGFVPTQVWTTVFSWVEIQDSCSVLLNFVF